MIFYYTRRRTGSSVAQMVAVDALSLWTVRLLPSLLLLLAGFNPVLTFSDWYGWSPVAESVNCWVHVSSTLIWTFVTGASYRDKPRLFNLLSIESCDCETSKIWHYCKRCIYLSRIPVQGEEKYSWDFARSMDMLSTTLTVSRNPVSYSQMYS